MRRKDFLRYATAGVAGIAAAKISGVLGGVSARAETPSAAPRTAANALLCRLPARFKDGNGVLEDDFSYRGRRVQIFRFGTERMMRLDGRDLPPHAFSWTFDGAASHLLPYRTDRNARDMAEALIDDDSVLFVL
jgi:hypothetical protein